MTYQYKREPLTQHEASNLANACETHAEHVVVWTLLDTGLRVSELTSLMRQHFDWQQHRLIIYGKGGPFGPRSKRRILPLSGRVRALLEPHFSVHDCLGMGPRTVQRLVKRVANRAAVVRPVTPHVLRHTLAVTAVQKGHQPADPATPARARLPGHDADLPQPVARGRHQRVSPKVVSGPCTRRSRCMGLFLEFLFVSPPPGGHRADDGLPARFNGHVLDAHRLLSGLPAQPRQRLQSACVKVRSSFAARLP